MSEAAMLTTSRSAIISPSSPTAESKPPISSAVARCIEAYAGFKPVQRDTLYRTMFLN